MTAKHARSIRKRSQKHSQYQDGLGVSELFLADTQAAQEILAARDVRLKCYLLGFSNIPPQGRSDMPITRHLIA